VGVPERNHEGILGLSHYGIVEERATHGDSGNGSTGNSGIRRVRQLKLPLIGLHLTYVGSFYAGDGTSDLAYVDDWLISYVIGFEYAKRGFQKRYGPEIPVWALLTSGSCGGVSGYYASNNMCFDFALLPREAWLLVKVTLLVNSS
jgi:hypothetical protein